MKGSQKITSNFIALLLLLDTSYFDVLVDTANHTLKSLTRTTLCEVVSTVSNHILNA